MSYIVRVMDPSRHFKYICHSELRFQDPVPAEWTTLYGSSVQLCARGNDAHQFSEAAAEAVAFLVGGEAIEYNHREHSE